MHLAINFPSPTLAYPSPPPLRPHQAVFQDDLAYNINTHAFTNPDVADLLASLSRSDPRMAARVRPWLYSAGLPVVVVDVDENNGVIKFTQVRWGVEDGGGERGGGRRRTKIR